MTSNEPRRDALEMRGIIKQHGGVRPLRVASLRVARGESVSIGGIEAGVSEIFVNLVTGASLPDKGEVVVFGRRTADLGTSDDWLDSLDQFGIVSPRGVLLEGSTLLQNLAMPFTLAIDAIPVDIEQRVRELARRCGIDPDRWLESRAGDVSPEIRVRSHLARALALEPALLLIEHPTAEVDPGARAGLAADVARVCTELHATTLVLTNDDGFARAVAPRNLTLHGATGELKPLRKGWFGR